MSSPPRDRAATWIRLAPLLLVAALVVAFVIWRQLPRPADQATPASEPAADTAEAAEPGAPQRERTAAAPTPSELERAWVEATGAPPNWPAESEGGADCEAAVRELRALAGRLDALPAVRARKLPGGTFALLTGLSQDLAARPPVVDGALSTLDNVRANIAHLFRALGERRLNQLRAIAGAHPEFVEPLALATYRWMRSEESCADDQPRPMPFRSQYAYAAFLLQTIGGQAYLRRRAPRHEALAVFYSLRVVERAIESRDNPFGATLQPEVDRCLELMRAETLVFRDRYVEILERMRREHAPG